MTRFHCPLFQCTPTFTNGPSGSGPANPAAALTLGPDGNFYGASLHGGGISGYSTLFKATTNGMLTMLTNFNYGNGASPYGGLALGPDGNFYGTTWQGGANGYGTVFQVTANGTLTTLASFSGSNGASPYAGLTLGPDGVFYGTTIFGGYTNLNYRNGYGMCSESPPTASCRHWSTLTFPMERVLMLV